MSCVQWQNRNGYTIRHMLRLLLTYNRSLEKTHWKTFRNGWCVLHDLPKFKLWVGNYLGIFIKKCNRRNIWSYIIHQKIFGTITDWALYSIAVLILDFRISSIKKKAATFLLMWRASRHIHAKVRICVDYCWCLYQNRLQAAVGKH